MSSAHRRQKRTLELLELESGIGEPPDVVLGTELSLLCMLLTTEPCLQNCHFSFYRLPN